MLCQGSYLEEGFVLHVTVIGIGKLLDGLDWKNKNSEALVNAVDGTGWDSSQDNFGGALILTGAAMPVFQAMQQAYVTSTHC
jgi:hypothetical protein